MRNLASVSVSGCGLSLGLPERAATVIGTVSVAFAAGGCRVEVGVGVGSVAGHGVPPGAEPLIMNGDPQ